MKAILKALSGFQMECPAIKKGADNPFFKSKYASLDAIQHVANPKLLKHGLVAIQPTTWIDGQCFVRTIVYHVDSGESIESLFPVITQKNTAQEYGSAVSYAKRYSYTGLLNIIVDDGSDDDGNVASGNQATITSTKTPSSTLVWLDEKHAKWNEVVDKFKNNTVDVATLKKYFKLSKAIELKLTSLKKPA